MDPQSNQYGAPKPVEPPAPATAPNVPEPAPAVSMPEWRQTTQPVFVVEDSFYRSRTPPRPVHWSIAWSDLMMTMFILFLTLFAHLRTHPEIQAHGTPSKVADETIPVRADNAKSTLIFHPISQDVSGKTAEHLPETLQPRSEQQGADILIRNRLNEDDPAEPLRPIPEVALRQPAAAREEQILQPHSQAAAPPASPVEPLIIRQQEEVITKIYDLSKLTLAKEKLERFATVEMVEDKTMRIILTGDLLFASGQAELTSSATVSLNKLADIIKKTPYMVNVIGHTDDRSVKNVRFPSNWELSLARASRVARFLIEATKMPATQFSVSGYSSFRPIKPNTSEENRRANRRVEIVLSKDLPQVEAAAPSHLQ